MPINCKWCRIWQFQTQNNSAQNQISIHIVHISHTVFQLILMVNWTSIGGIWMLLFWTIRSDAHKFITGLIVIFSMLISNWGWGITATLVMLNTTGLTDISIGTEIGTMTFSAEQTSLETVLDVLDFLSLYRRLLISFFCSTDVLL